MTKCLTILSICLLPFFSNATNYYFSNEGSDSNSGTSTGSPFATISKLNTVHLVEGDNVYFKRGDIFYGTITIAYSGSNGNPITYSAYGTGANPVINGGDNNISTNDKSYIVIRDLELKSTGTTAFAGSLNIGTHSVVGIEIRNCIIDNNRGNGISVDGITVMSLIIDSCAIYNNGDFGILLSNITDFTSGQISNCKIYSNGSYSNSDAEYISNIQGNLANFNIYHNEIYDAAPGTAYGHAECHGIYISTPSTSAVNIYNNIIHDNTNGDGIKARYSANIYNNSIYSNRLSAIELGGNGSTNAIYHIYWNIMYRSTAGFSGVFESAKGTGNIYSKIYNNTFYKNGNEFATTKEMSIEDNLDSLQIKNNIFYGADNHGGVSIVNQSGFFECDYNLYYQDVGNTVSNIYNGVTYSSFSSWHTAGYDAHGITADPLFINAHLKNFNLSFLSPAISAGVNVGLIFNGAFPTIGALEYEVFHGHIQTSL